MLLRCESLEPPMSQWGQIRSFCDVRLKSGLPESGKGWAIYEYTPWVRESGSLAARSQKPTHQMPRPLRRRPQPDRRRALELLVRAMDRWTRPE
jgi:hypothetical protein